MDIRCLRFSILVFTLGVLVLGISAEFPCKGDLEAIILNCKEFVEKDTPQIPPSQACCETLKASDIPCLCKNVPPEDEKLISMEKTIYVLTTCGCEIPPPGDKCGSKLVFYHMHNG